MLFIMIVCITRRFDFIHNDKFLQNISDKRDDFDIEIVMRT